VATTDVQVLLRPTEEDAGNKSEEDILAKIRRALDPILIPTSASSWKKRLRHLSFRRQLLECRRPHPAHPF
jgi:hypothetical protein